MVNAKRVYRLWRERDFLIAPRCKTTQDRQWRKQLREDQTDLSESRAVLQLSFNATPDGRSLKWMAVIDENTRECHTLGVDRCHRRAGSSGLEMRSACLRQV